LAISEIQDYLRLLPNVKHSPEKYVWMSYDSEGDTLYINFKKPSHASDSEITEDDIIIRYEGEEVVGFTVLHASPINPATMVRVFLGCHKETWRD